MYFCESRTYPSRQAMNKWIMYCITLYLRFYVCVYIWYNYIHCTYFSMRPVTFVSPWSFYMYILHFSIVYIQLVSAAINKLFMLNIVCKINYPLISSVYVVCSTLSFSCPTANMATNHCAMNRTAVTMVTNAPCAVVYRKLHQPSPQ